MECFCSSHFSQFALRAHLSAYALIEANSYVTHCLSFKLTPHPNLTTLLWKHLVRISLLPLRTHPHQTHRQGCYSHRHSYLRVLWIIHVEAIRRQNFQERLFGGFQESPGTGKIRSCTHADTWIKALGIHSWWIYDDFFFRNFTLDSGWILGIWFITDYWDKILLEMCLSGWWATKEKLQSFLSSILFSPVKLNISAPFFLTKYHFFKILVLTPCSRTPAYLFLSFIKMSTHLIPLFSFTAAL